jgi:stage III sporulation protein SpoIIIAA
MVRFITATRKLAALLDDNGGKPVATSARVIGVHFQFAQEQEVSTDSDRVVAIAIGNDSPTSEAVVLQIDSLGVGQVIAGLGALLEDPPTVKVLFNLDRAARWLHRCGAGYVSPKNCLDLQLLYKQRVKSKKAKASLSTVVSALAGPSTVAMERQVAAFNAKLKSKAWTKSPLAPPMVNTLIQSMQLYARCYHSVCGMNGGISELPRVVAATEARWYGALPKLVEPSSADATAAPAAHQEVVLEASAGAASDASNEKPAAVKLPLAPLMVVDSEREQDVVFRSPFVGVHFQFASQSCTNSSSDPNREGTDELVAITIFGPAAKDPTVVLHMVWLSNTRAIRPLKALLMDSATTKVMHDVHRAAYWLHCNGLGDVELVNCIDLQLLYETTVDSTALHADILRIATHCFPEPSENLAQSMHSFKASLRPVETAEWMHAPLSQKLLQTLAQTTKLYAQCYEELSPGAPLKNSCAAMTRTRWQFAVENRGRKAIWFDPKADNQPRSAECLMLSSSSSATPAQVDILPLELQCELAPLLDLLPMDYRDAILAVDNYQNCLVDVCLDVGRIPYVYAGKKQRVVLSRNGETVTKDTIDEIIMNLGGDMRIGDDNRAGIDRQLHRISVMRSKTDEVYGLTMRVGRALRNAACVLTDLLLSERHADKSVLVLGHPGSGKTTLIRDVARCISETMENVCIIDTSNEIGGDGLVPHACVGWARRMMVRSLELQAGVMVECVQNHTVETLIVDEIGRKAEVLAASTVRQRGPRLIASAHGDFRALMKNPDLKGLVGGSQQVIVGDSAAAQSASKSKLQTQRAGNPIFDVIVELDRVVRGRCRIIWDVAKAVDSVFEGNGYAFETRQWDVNTRGVLLLDE